MAAIRKGLDPGGLDDPWGDSMARDFRGGRATRWPRDFRAGGRATKSPKIGEMNLKYENIQT